MWGWWRRRGTDEAAPALASAPGAAETFDASIDFDPAALADGVTPEQVRAAVGAVPGAGWVSVEPHQGAALDVRLFEAGSGVEAAGSRWDRLREELEAAIRGLTGGMWGLPMPAPGGFAESAAQFAALEQLSALAAAAQISPADISPVPAPPALAPPPAAPRAQAPRPRRAKAPAPAPPPPLVAPAAPELAVAEGDAFRLQRLLALVLPADASEPARAAVRRFGSFAAVLAAPEAELRRVPGLGTHCIAAIKLLHAAAVRHARAGIAAGRPVLDDPKRLADYLAAALARERIEQFRVLFLDAAGMLRADEVQAQGTVNHTPVYPREVVRRALALEATALILVHNHPSGDPEPSREDLEMTRQVQQAAAVLGIALRDHVIVGNGRSLSFREAGLLD